jgi:hypothetical protein
MRIALNQPFPVSGQVCVEWDGHFFVGNGRHIQARDNEYVLGLALVSSSYSGFMDRWTLELRGLAAHFGRRALELLAKR